MAVKNVRGLRHAAAVYNGQMFGMRTMSGCGVSGVDDSGATHFLPSQISNRALGFGLRDCLENSRLLDQHEYNAFFAKEEKKRNKHSWSSAMSANMGTKPIAALSKKMAWIGVYTADGDLHLQPTYNASGREWLFLSDRDVKDIKIRYDSDDAVIGAALREAFMRCEGAGRADLTFEEPLPD